MINPNRIYGFCKKNLGLIIVITIALLLRLYNSSDWFFWNVDEDILGITVKRILIDHRPQLLGFPIPGGIYLGPLIYYLISVAYFISRMNPFGLSVFAAILGTVTTFLVYFTGKTLFSNRTIGLIAAIIYAVSSLVNVYTRVFSALTFAPILALSTYLLLYGSLIKKKPYKILLFSLILAFASQNEGSSLSLIALSIMIFLIYRIRLGLKNISTIIATVFLSQIPLFIFDVRHDFFVLRSLFNFVLKFKGIGTDNLGLKLPTQAFQLFPNTFSRFLFVTGEKDITSQILPCADLVKDRLNNITLPAILVSLIISGFFIVSQFIKNKSSPGSRIILIHLLIGVFGIIIYNFFLPGYTHEWILVVFFPAFALITGYFLNVLLHKSMYLKILSILFLALFIFFNVNWIYNTGNKFGLLSKTAAVKYAVSEIGNQPFALDTLGSCFSQGYIYLFYYYGHLPVKSYADDMFSSTIFLHEQPEPELKVVMVNPSRVEDEQFWQKYYGYKSREIKSRKINEIEVLVVKN